MYTYSLIVDRKSYNLPPKNIRMVEEMERVSRIDSVHGLSTRGKFEEILGFIVDTLGEDNAKAVLGSVSVDEVDLSVVTVTFRMIVDAYNKPITDYNTKRNNELFASLPSDKIDRVTKLMEVAEVATGG
jgi:hypothetical protein